MSAAEKFVKLSLRLLFFWRNWNRRGKLQLSLHALDRAHHHRDLAHEVQSVREIKKDLEDHGEKLEVNSIVRAALVCKRVNLGVLVREVSAGKLKQKGRKALLDLDDVMRKAKFSH